MADRPLMDLFSDLWRQTALLFRQEADLAKAEISEKVSQVETAVASLAVGAVVLHAGFLLLLAAAVAGLMKLLPVEHAAWIAPLIVGVVVLIAGAVLLAKGRRTMKAGSLAPTRTMQSVRRDMDLAKEHAR